MPDIAPTKGPAGYETLRLPRHALKALTGLGDISGGGLSPLVRMKAPEGEGKAEDLISAFESLDETWKWAVPAMLDPHYTIAILAGDGHLNFQGQYVFPVIRRVFEVLLCVG